MKKETLNYHDGHDVCKGYVAYQDHISDAPAVLIAHDWTGLNDFAKQTAKNIAELGYVGIAMDIYSQGQTGNDNDEKMALMQPLLDDRGLLKRRLEAALHAVKLLNMVDKSKVAAIGFCFGGHCVLEMARHNMNVAGVVSFHGLLTAGSPLEQTITSQVLALHGYADPMVEPNDVLAFGKEMEACQADWQLHAYGGVKHAFTNPSANDHDFGTVFDQTAAKRSWLSMQNFLQEVFAG